MSVLEAVVLGLVQGITEFLPISSTAHLKIVPSLLGWGDPGAAYSAVIQLGTVAAVLVYFAKDLTRLLKAFVQGLLARAPFGTVDSRLAWFVGLGTIPIGLGGLLLKKHIEGSLRSLWVIAGSLIVLAAVLAVVEKVAAKNRPLESLTLKDGVVIGLCQSLALIPGSSRSGTTLTGGLLVGLTREAAARYSFLLSIPATGLAGVFELKHLLEASERPETSALVIGTVVSFVSGMLAIHGLLQFLRTRSTLVFIVYRVVLGLALFALLGAGVLQP
ncbi:MAG: undecaprenyl-diphosphate phosphatase [Myxococcaceae bacterium]|nr:undecaprenyl-diphosphate phosphatase [Myxococcaceae bacterium]